MLHNLRLVGGMPFVEKLTHIINMRISTGLRRRLDAIHKRYGTNDSEVIRRLLDAWVDHTEATDAVRWPIWLGEERTPLLSEEQAAAYGSLSTITIFRKALEQAERAVEAAQQQPPPGQQKEKTEPES